MSEYEFHPIVYDYDDLTPTEREAMRTSLKQVGLLQPIVVWQDQIVDGRHRETLCREERISRTYKNITPRCPTEEKMREYVRALNQHRRSRTAPLTSEEKRAKAAAAIKADPERSDVAIAEELGDVSRPTVHRVRKELEETGVVQRTTPLERKSRTGNVGEGARKTTPPSARASRGLDAIMLAQPTMEKAAAKLAATATAAPASPITNSSTSGTETLSQYLDSFKAQIQGPLATLIARINSPESWPHGLSNKNQKSRLSKASRKIWVARSDIYDALIELQKLAEPPKAKADTSAKPSTPAPPAPEAKPEPLVWEAAHALVGGLPQKLPSNYTAYTSDGGYLLEASFAKGLTGSEEFKGYRIVRFQRGLDNEELATRLGLKAAQSFAQSHYAKRLEAAEAAA